MSSRTGPPQAIAALLAQLRVPENWEVLSNASLAGGWLGVLEASLAVLAPGPEGGAGHRAQLHRAQLHRAQLVVFLLTDASAGAHGTVLQRVQLAAAANIPEAWLIDSVRGWTEVHRAPFDGRYRSRQICYPGEVLHPLALTRTAVVPIARP